MILTHYNACFIIMYAITRLQNISKQVSTLAVAILYLLHYVNFKVIMTSLAQLSHEQPLMHKTLLLSQSCRL